SICFFVIRLAIGAFTIVRANERGDCEAGSHRGCPGPRLILQYTEPRRRVARPRRPDQDGCGLLDAATPLRSPGQRQRRPRLRSRSAGLVRLTPAATHRRRRVTRRPAARSRTWWRAPAPGPPR